MQTTEHTERCPKCSGKGTRWRTIDGIRGPYTCGGCKGLGERAYAASAEKRAHTNAVAKVRKERKLVDAITAFQAEHPRIWAWMVFSGEGTFGAKMHDALLKWGGLTDRQMASSKKYVR